MQEWDTPQLVKFLLTLIGSLIGKAKEEGKALADDPPQVTAAVRQTPSDAAAKCLICTSHAAIVIAFLQPPKPNVAPLSSAPDQMM